MTFNSIINRYAALSESDENLSCGSPVLFSDVRQGDVCVDLGCGTGKDCMELSELVGVKGKVIGIDVTEAMIEKARNNSKKNLYENCEFIQSAFENIPLSDNSVDHVFSGCAINHSNNKIKVFEEIFRILKTGEKAVISDIYSLEPIKNEYKSNPEKVAECWAGAVTKDEYFDIITKAGFKDILIIKESKAYKKSEAMIKSFIFTITKPQL